MARILADIRTRSPLAQYANQRYEGVPVDVEGAGYSDLESGGRRFRYSHSQRTITATGERREWLVFDDVGPINGRLVLAGSPGTGQPLVGTGLRVGSVAA